MKKIPTAEEFVSSYSPDTRDQVPEMLIEFAKLHVKAALEAAAENAETTEYYGALIIDDESILSAYPEENIK